MPTIPGEEFNFDIPYYTQKLGELSVLLEREQRRRMILFGAYMELKNKYEPETEPQPEPQVELDINDSVQVDAPDGYGQPVLAAAPKPTRKRNRR